MPFTTYYKMRKFGRRNFEKSHFFIASKQPKQPKNGEKKNFVRAKRPKTHAKSQYQMPFIKYYKISKFGRRNFEKYQFQCIKIVKKSPNQPKNGEKKDFIRAQMPKIYVKSQYLMPFITYYKMSKFGRRNFEKTLFQCVKMDKVAKIQRKKYLQQK